MADFEKSELDILPGHFVSLGGDPIPSEVWAYPEGVSDEDREKLLLKAAELIVEADALGLGKDRILIRPS